jgi:hypothetical protein
MKAPSRIEIRRSAVAAILELDLEVDTSTNQSLRRTVPRGVTRARWAGLTEDHMVILALQIDGLTDLSRHRLTRSWTQDESETGRTALRAARPRPRGPGADPSAGEGESQAGATCDSRRGPENSE